MTVALAGCVRCHGQAFDEGGDFTCLQCGAVQPEQLPDRFNVKYERLQLAGLNQQGRKARKGPRVVRCGNGWVERDMP